VAHLSAFSRTSSWLGRTGGLLPFGIFGSWIFLSMIDLLKRTAYALEDEASMNKILILLIYFTHLGILSGFGELEGPTQS
jgi:hypothetical protein